MSVNNDREAGKVRIALSEGNELVERLGGLFSRMHELANEVETRRNEGTTSTVTNATSTRLLGIEEQEQLLEKIALEGVPLWLSLQCCLVKKCANTRGREAVLQAALNLLYGTADPYGESSLIDPPATSRDMLPVCQMARATLKKAIEKGIPNAIRNEIYLILDLTTFEPHRLAINPETTSVEKVHTGFIQVAKAILFGANLFESALFKHKGLTHTLKGAWKRQRAAQTKDVRCLIQLFHSPPSPKRSYALAKALLNFCDRLGEQRVGGNFADHLPRSLVPWFTLLIHHPWSKFANEALKAEGGKLIETFPFPEEFVIAPLEACTAALEEINALPTRNQPFELFEGIKEKKTLLAHNLKTRHKEWSLSFASLASFPEHLKRCSAHLALPFSHSIEQGIALRILLIELPAIQRNIGRAKEEFLPLLREMDAKKCPQEFTYLKAVLALCLHIEQIAKTSITPQCMRVRSTFLQEVGKLKPAKKAPSKKKKKTKAKNVRKPKTRIEKPTSKKAKVPVKEEAVTALPLPKKVEAPKATPKVPSKVKKKLPKPDISIPSLVKTLAKKSTKDPTRAAWKKAALANLKLFMDQYEKRQKGRLFTLDAQLGDLNLLRRILEATLVAVTAHATECPLTTTHQFQPWVDNLLFSDGNLRNLALSHEGLLRIFSRANASVFYHFSTGKSLKFGPVKEFNREIDEVIDSAGLHQIKYKKNVFACVQDFLKGAIDPTFGASLLSSRAHETNEEKTLPNPEFINKLANRGPPLTSSTRIETKRVTKGVTTEVQAVLRIDEMVEKIDDEILSMKVVGRGAESKRHNFRNQVLQNARLSLLRLKDKLTHPLRSHRIADTGLDGIDLALHALKECLTAALLHYPLFNEEGVHAVSVDNLFYERDLRRHMNHINTAIPNLFTSSHTRYKSLRSIHTKISYPHLAPGYTHKDAFDPLIKTYISLHNKERAQVGNLDRLDEKIAEAIERAQHDYIFPLLSDTFKLLTTAFRPL